MSFTIITRHADGTRSKQLVNIEGDPVRAERRMREAMRDRKKRLRDKKGWSKGKEFKLLGSVPKAIWEYTVKNHGAAAARDFDFVARVADELGYDVRVGR